MHTYSQYIHTDTQKDAPAPMQAEWTAAITVKLVNDVQGAYVSQHSTVTLTLGPINTHTHIHTHTHTHTHTQTHTPGLGQRSIAVKLSCTDVLVHATKPRGWERERDRWR
jgi:hypothetical protein